MIQERESMPENMAAKRCSGKENRGGTDAENKMPNGDFGNPEMCTIIFPVDTRFLLGQPLVFRWLMLNIQLNEV